MEIGIISATLRHNHRTGVPNYVFNLIEGLNRIKSKKDNFYLVNYEHNILFSDLHEIICKNPLNNISQMYLWYCYMVLNINSQNCNIDLIHNPFQIPTYFKFKKQRYIITIHDLTPILFSKTHSLKRSLVYKLLLPKTLKTADKIIADSNSTKDDLVNYFNLPENKIKVIYLAADNKFNILKDTEIQSIKHKYNLNLPFVLYVGTLEPRKNIVTLLKAFSKLKEKVHHKLVIVGNKGWKFKEIFETVDKLDLQNYIIFTGYVQDADLPALYNAADLFVYPSLYEGFGLPPLEAMACGCPVITSNTSSLPEVVGDAGIMVDPYDIDGLADSMYKVLTDEGLRINMSKKGLDRAKMFSWEKCAKETFKVYEEVYAQSKV
ncbi:MAG: glycosyltransferase family 1 protein [Methanosarcina sp.]|uniref:glycosyltransferase family 4 protein n=1 Tax=Methanosarcina sp. TaxID=2213 RepID=UPI0026370F10|nr:glycosyltransferase family 1 protein [Methanosarcina sp.]MDD3245398.1 glycosyltransferase family 1 protein [Methanosarcina sp.]MDD4247587.1 glycosyltransferase family 1 protein [Methanosarcina sp.]